jgi:large subunit ribosomal protein L17
MRHRKRGRKLNRTWSHRKAMLRNMVTTFLDRGEIETTDAKAKELRSLAERLVTLAKRGGDDLAARRHAMKIVREKAVVAKLFDEIGPRYADRPGGYTRIVKIETRRGDGAPLSILKFVEEEVTFKERKQRREEPRAAAAAGEPPAEAEAAEGEAAPEETVEAEAAEPEETPEEEAAAPEEAAESAEEPGPEEEAEKEG